MSANKASERVRALEHENEDLKRRLYESEETLRAIREGEVDAVVVTGSEGVQILSLTGAETPYRLIVETMKEAAVTTTFEGKILYCNSRFSDLIKRTDPEVIAHSIQEFVDETEKASIPHLLVGAQKHPLTRRLLFRAADQTPVPAHISATLINRPDEASICIVASDLTELENSTELIQQLRLQKEALRFASARITSVLEQMSDCFAAFDREWRYTHVNAAAENAFHMTRDQLLGNRSGNCGRRPMICQLESISGAHWRKKNRCNLNVFIRNL